MKNLGTLIVTKLRTLGKALSLEQKEAPPYVLPYKNLEYVDGYHVPKKSVVPYEPDDMPLPKSSARPPRLYLIRGGKSSQST